MSRRYGWRPSLPDQRDLIADTSDLPVPREVDPRHRMPPVYDQGDLGSCTANAVAAAIEADAIIDNRDIGGTPSRLDIYAGERLLEHTPLNEDSGAYGRDGFKFAHSTGVIPESEWPYDVARFDRQPPAFQRRKIGAYRVVKRTVTDFKRALGNEQTVAVGFSVYESFESPTVAKTGVMPMPSRRERLLGGHEVLVVGYLAAKPDYALTRNSWGTGWGMGGYFLMPWDVLLRADLSSDFRTIYRPGR